ncbi:hypothetical protein [Pontibacter populi]|uniref:Uncharacterized protein n=1 Tax=Pontibacter populi TaxID=890055 RepID=A0ABV1RWR8_9BACT
MKIKCSCDNVIVNQIDNLRYKGYIISDVDWSAFWDSIDNKIKNSVNTKAESETVQLEMQKMFRTAWECKKCGKLHIQAENGQLCHYTPDNDEYNQVLNKTE